MYCAAGSDYSVRGWLLNIQEIFRPVSIAGNFKLALVGVFTHRNQQIVQMEAPFCLFRELVYQPTTGLKLTGAGTS